MARDMEWRRTKSLNSCGDTRSPGTARPCAWQQRSTLRAAVVLGADDHGQGSCSWTASAAAQAFSRRGAGALSAADATKQKQGQVVGLEKKSLTSIRNARGEGGGGGGGGLGMSCKHDSNAIDEHTPKNVRFQNTRAVLRTRTGMKPAGGCPISKPRQGTKPGPSHAERAGQAPGPRSQQHAQVWYLKVSGCHSHGEMRQCVHENKRGQRPCAGVTKQRKKMLGRTDTRLWPRCHTQQTNGRSMTRFGLDVEQKREEGKRKGKRERKKKRREG